MNFKSFPTRDAVCFLEGPSSTPGALHLERGQKHPDFRPKQSPRKSGPEPLEGVGGYERQLGGGGCCG